MDDVRRFGDAVKEGRYNRLIPYMFLLLVAFVAIRLVWPSSGRSGRQKVPGDILPWNSHIPVLTLPYPAGAKFGTVTLCNYSGRDYWFGFVNRAKQKQFVHVPPRTDQCVQVGHQCPTPPATCGHVAPCHPGMKGCGAQHSRKVSAGVGVVDIYPHAAAKVNSEGMAKCRVHCTEGDAVCATNTVVYFSPLKCKKVEVMTKSKHY
mmetsp:Transcript_75699/g.177674  ORF Transcript_75699/g.177674 Transcript_75699/m.177674 type:complete len:205 (+) Transcript_75699:21-635(+)|eukprot:CAMPEP_0175817140 /NCGR_PEP_ID=MMETSP0107_2-20121207/6859_1 /TAXON_ID=195067 ORGANISM="Goniomonas pacifica, Strain CCMP1869" /NCGR_SAMPLE_ID=MMETSP0107_2 /ASSEMBLY_ACC=CAM_ASM_000203 /LENGTH=204 /DNA_ID=CAMNT_0017129265 /DNA_START=11 /DNA_END=628 /DNA_ORIENTATION=-